MTKSKWRWEPTDRWVRAFRDGQVIANSKNPVLMLEGRGEQDYYFPVADVKMELFEESDYTESDEDRGIKKFWNLRMNGDLIKNAAWTYEQKDERPDFTDHIALDWHAMEHWYEEEEEIFNHPRNPYHRVDFIPSSRHIEVIVDGVKLASTDHPLLVFETNLPTRYYIPQTDVNHQYFEPTELKTHCPYKGDCDYYDIVVNNNRYENAAWTYPNPLPEAPRLKGTLAFWAEKDQRIQLLVDGKQV
ncbi:DUF427 domain-containing protein [Chloroflexi bacterium TSY]|nr:DUF427 domain-containing protein [Chloroflexi bacterium TSY]